MRFCFFLLTSYFILLPSSFLLPTCHTVPLVLKYATTDEEAMWGLMQCPELPWGHGMLFHYSPPRKVSLWAFNCLVDLSVAFLDGEGVIREFAELKAYPEMMDPDRPVRCLKDMCRYSPHDPVVRFFRRRAVTSSFPASYALEVPRGWFEAHNIRVGNTLDVNGLLREASPEYGVFRTVLLFKSLVE